MMMHYGQNNPSWTKAGIEQVEMVIFCYAADMDGDGDMDIKRNK